MSDDATRFDQLDEDVKALLRRLSPAEVETLTYLSTIPKDELRGMMKMFRDVRAVSWFLRWLFFAVAAVFVTASALGESFAKVMHWFRGPP
nr:hypothetical protein [Mesorhizobium sp.]